MKQLIDADKLKTSKSYLTVEEVMSILHISQNTLYRYINKGFFKKIKFKNRNYILKSTVSTYIDDIFNKNK